MSKAVKSVLTAPPYNNRKKHLLYKINSRSTKTLFIIAETDLVCRLRLFYGTRTVSVLFVPVIPMKMGIHF
jgi:hypothetical protein